MASSVWIVEGADKTAYCDDGSVTTIVGVATSKVIAEKIKKLSEDKGLAFDFVIYEVDADTPLPFGEENPSRRWK